MFKRLILAGAVLAASVALAHAQGLPVKALPTLSSTSNPCQVATASTPLQCTGMYVGGGVGNEGANGSLTISGAVSPTFDVGYQYVTSNWIFAGEFDLDYSVNASALSPAGGYNFNGFRTREIFKIGGNMNGLIQNPVQITVPASLASSVLGVYAGGGLEQWYLPGAVADGQDLLGGLLFDVSAHWFGDLRYTYTNFANTKLPAGINLQNDQEVRLTFNYKF